MKYVGGPLDGQDRVQPVLGRILLVSIETPESTAAYSAWYEEWGLAWSAYNLEHLYRDCPIPAPPRAPHAIYVVTHDDDESVLMFQRMEVGA